MLFRRLFFFDILTMFYSMAITSRSLRVATALLLITCSIADSNEKQTMKHKKAGQIVFDLPGSLINCQKMFFNPFINGIG